MMSAIQSCPPKTPNSLFQDLDEALNLELEGTNPSPIAINGSIIDAGQPVKFVLVNKNAFENGKSRVKVSEKWLKLGFFRKQRKQ